ncbi:uncharacterized protein [Callorhinus ursinus]|uniref:uncharacterized protein n=1 Tax=Callorhinus ursinus TaxID=34884 RepID=UPI003CD04F3B
MEGPWLGRKRQRGLLPLLQDVQGQPGTVPEISGGKPFAVLLGGRHFLPEQDLPLRVPVVGAATLNASRRRSREQSLSQGLPRLHPGGDLAVSGGDLLVLGRPGPGAAVAGDGAALPTSLLTDALVFQKKGATTIQDTRKEQVPDVSFRELQKMHLVRAPAPYLPKRERGPSRAGKRSCCSPGRASPSRWEASRWVARGVPRPEQRACRPRAACHRMAEKGAPPTLLAQLLLLDPLGLRVTSRAIRKVG